jgi:hypothetical protein
MDKYYNKFVRFFDPTTYLANSEVPKTLNSPPEKVVVCVLSIQHVRDNFTLQGIAHENAERCCKPIDLLCYIKKQAIEKRIISEKFWLAGYSDTNLVREIVFPRVTGTRIYPDVDDDISYINKGDLESEFEESSEEDSNFDNSELEGTDEGTQNSDEDN